MLTELNDECLLDIEECLRLNASMVAAMVAVGGRFEGLTVRNLTRLVDAGSRYSIPRARRDGRGQGAHPRCAAYLAMASAFAENGAHVVKTYYCKPDFEHVVACCPVPIVIAGGKKLPEADALAMAYEAIDQGAAGVDMGRNVFRPSAPRP